MGFHIRRVMGKELEKVGLAPIEEKRHKRGKGQVMGRKKKEL